MRKIRIPENLTALAYRQIKSYILEGRLDQGQRLTEEFVAQQLGTSKSPIREAFNRLETEGLIRIEPRRGAYLRSFSTDEIADIYDLREALETHAVATAEITPAVLEELRASVARSNAAHDANERLRYFEEDMRFHAAIAEATGNQRLARVLENLQDQVSLFRRKTYDLSSSKAVEVHVELVSALAADDREKAVDLMRAHIRGTRDKLLQHLSSNSSAA